MEIKKHIILLGCLILMSSLVFAAQQGVHDSGTGIENPDLRAISQGTGQGLDENKTDVAQTGNGTSDGQSVNTVSQTANQGDSQQLQNKEQVKTQLHELKQTMQQKQQQLNSESEGSGEKVQQMMKNQNQVRVAAQTLTQMEGLLGNKGQQVSAIAKEFDNSVQTTMNSEEKIQTRSAFSRFFAGGDKKTSEEIELQVTKNQERIQELKQLKEQAECDEEVKIMMQEQIQQMEQEQTRLSELAQKEKKSKGLFGWIWK